MSFMSSVCYFKVECVFLCGMCVLCDVEFYVACVLFKVQCVCFCMECVSCVSSSFMSSVC